ncbi:GNAT family N-acetyltransferase [Terrarubrum flagellatum]|uniref:GNAT family N-acetyltransferase n=1 Tax=Terrirubrum flagellatum TaxID=2895980 RepID=UPI0031451D41
MVEAVTFSIPILRTERLTIRAIHASDHGDLLALAHDAKAMRFMHEGPPPSSGDVWTRMTMALGQWALRGYGMMVAEDRDGFVGRLGFFHPQNAPDPLLVYAIASRAWGRGYATEGVKAVVDWMIATHRPDRIIGNIDPQNTASVRVAEKLGAKRIGTTKWADALLDAWVFHAEQRRPS